MRELTSNEGGPSSRYASRPLVLFPGKPGRECADEGPPVLLSETIRSNAAAVKPKHSYRERIRGLGRRAPPSGRRCRQGRIRILGRHSAGRPPVPACSQRPAGACALTTQTQEPSKPKSAYVDEAVQLAVDARWEEAVELNEFIIQSFG